MAIIDDTAADPRLGPWAEQLEEAFVELVAIIAEDTVARFESAARPGPPATDDTDEEPSAIVAASGDSSYTVDNPDDLFSEEEWRRLIEDRIGPLLGGIIADGASANGYGYDFDATNPRMARAVAQHLSAIREWGPDIRAAVAHAVSRGVTEGWSIDRMTRHLRETGPMSAQRARLIARTECLLPSAVVDGAEVVASYRRPWSGQVVEIVTESGHQFTGTPNHPVLTPLGWRGLGELSEGDDVLRHRFDVEAPGATGDMDVQHPPVTLGEIHDASTTVGVRKRTATAQPDFHGDGLDGDVDVAVLHRPLLVGRFAPLDERSVEGVLSPADLPELARRARNAPLDRRPSVDGRVHLGSGSGDSRFTDDSGDRSVGDPERHGDRADGLAAQVTLDEILWKVFDLVRGFASGMEEAMAARRAIVRNAPVVEGGADRPVVAGDLVERLAEHDVTGGVGALTGGRSLHRPDCPEMATYGGGIATETTGDPTSTPALTVETDRVVEVRLRDYSGHVHNLMTETGYFFADGLITSNSISASNRGELEGYRAVFGEGVGIKEWIATRDPRTRPTHVRANGQIVAADDRFQVGSGTADYPGDPSLPLRERVSCRCSLIYDPDGAVPSAPDDEPELDDFDFDFDFPRPDPLTRRADRQAWRRRGTTRRRPTNADHRERLDRALSDRPELWQQMSDEVRSGTLTSGTHRAILDAAEGLAGADVLTESTIVYLPATVASIPDTGDSDRYVTTTWEVAPLVPTVGYPPTTRPPGHPVVYEVALPSGFETYVHDMGRDGEEPRLVIPPGTAFDLVEPAGTRTIDGVAHRVLRVQLAPSIRTTQSIPASGDPIIREDPPDTVARAAPKPQTPQLIDPVDDRPSNELIPPGPRTEAATWAHYGDDRAATIAEAARWPGPSDMLADADFSTGRPLAFLEEAKVSLQSMLDATASSRPTLPARHRIVVREVLAIRDPDDDNVQNLMLALDVVDAQGRVVAEASRRVEPDRGRAYNTTFGVNPSMQGQGIGSAVHRAMEDWYIAHGIERVELTADVDVGGYAWARAGYDWNPDFVSAEAVNWMLARAQLSGNLPPGYVDSIEWRDIRARVRAALDNDLDVDVDGDILREYLPDEFATDELVMPTTATSTIPATTDRLELKSLDPNARRMATRTVVARARRMIDDIADTFGVDLAARPSNEFGETNASDIEIDDSGVVDIAGVRTLLGAERIMVSDRIVDRIKDPDFGLHEFRILAHEAVHLLSDQDSFPATHDIEEATAEVLSQLWWHRRSQGLDARDAYRVEDGEGGLQTITDPRLILAYSTSYPAEVTETLRRAASKVGWNREAILAELTRMHLHADNKNQARLDFKDQTDPEFPLPEDLRDDLGPAIGTDAERHQATLLMEWMLRDPEPTPSLVRDPGFPTPFEIASLGNTAVGKQILLGSTWEGVKELATIPPVADPTGEIARAALVAELADRFGDERAEAIVQAGEWGDLTEMIDDADHPGWRRVFTANYSGGFATMATKVSRDIDGEMDIDGAVFHDGQQVGEFNRQLIPTFTEDSGGRQVAGPPFELHNYALRLDEHVQGQGFATAFYENVENWAIANGVDRVTLTANVDVGGYAWARRGFDWDPRAGDQIPDVIGYDTDGYVDDLQSYVDDGKIPAEYESPAARREAFLRDAAIWSTYVSLDSTDPEHPLFPTPEDLAKFGWHADLADGVSWPGRDMMLGAQWEGIKRLDEVEGPGRGAAPSTPLIRMTVNPADPGVLALVERGLLLPVAGRNRDFVAPDPAAALEALRAMRAEPSDLAERVRSEGDLSRAELSDAEIFEVDLFREELRDARSDAALSLSETIRAGIEARPTPQHLRDAQVVVDIADDLSFTVELREAGRMEAYLSGRVVDASGQLRIEVLDNGATRPVQAPPDAALTDAALSWQRDDNFGEDIENEATNILAAGERRPVGLMSRPDTAHAFDATAAADALLRGISTAPLYTDGTIYRGTVIDQFSLPRPGETVQMPLNSFSTDPLVADRFATTDGTRDTQIEVVYRIGGPVQGIQLGDFRGENEVLVTGEFNVESVEAVDVGPDARRYEVTLRQDQYVAVSPDNQFTLEPEPPSYDERSMTDEMTAGMAHGFAELFDTPVPVYEGELSSLAAGRQTDRLIDSFNEIIATTPDLNTIHRLNGAELSILSLTPGVEVDGTTVEIINRPVLMASLRNASQRVDLTEQTRQTVRDLLTRISGTAPPTTIPDRLRTAEMRIAAATLPHPTNTDAAAWTDAVTGLVPDLTVVEAASALNGWRVRLAESDTSDTPRDDWSFIVDPANRAVTLFAADTGDAPSDNVRALEVMDALKAYAQVHGMTIALRNSFVPAEAHLEAMRRGFSFVPAPQTAPPLRVERLLEIFGPREPAVSLIDEWVDRQDEVQADASVRREFLELIDSFEISWDDQKASGIAGLLDAEIRVDPIPLDVLADSAEIVQIIRTADLTAADLEFLQALPNWVAEDVGLGQWALYEPQVALDFHFNGGLGIDRTTDQPRPLFLEGVGGAGSAVGIRAARALTYDRPYLPAPKAARVREAIADSSTPAAEYLRHGMPHAPDEARAAAYADLAVIQSNMETISQNLWVRVPLDVVRNNQIDTTEQMVIASADAGEGALINLMGVRALPLGRVGGDPDQFLLGRGVLDQLTGTFRPAPELSPKRPESPETRERRLAERLPTPQALLADPNRAAVARVFESTFPGGFETKLSISTTLRSGLDVRGTITRDGRAAGSFHRIIDPSSGTARHEFLKLQEEFRGQRFASTFNRNLEAWYRANGIRQIRLHAALDVGGYAWARAGYDWEPNKEDEMARTIISWIEDAAGGRHLAWRAAHDGSTEQTARFEAARRVLEAAVEATLNGHADARSYIETHREAGRWNEAMDAAYTDTLALLDAIEDFQNGVDEIPTPWDVADLGSAHDLPIGQAILLGQEWYGVKYLGIDDSVVQLRSFPTEADVYQAQQIRDELLATPPKPPKIYDRSAADYGLDFHESFVDHPMLEMARRVPAQEWESLPTEQVDPSTLIAVENELMSKSIDKVVSGEVPLREGYTVNVLRLADGSMVIADGHHRAAMAAAMGRALDVKILDEAAVPAMAVEKSHWPEPEAAVQVRARGADPLPDGVIAYIAEDQFGELTDGFHVPGRAVFADLNRPATGVSTLVDLSGVPGLRFGESGLVIPAGVVFEYNADAAAFLASPPADPATVPSRSPDSYDPDLGDDRIGELVEASSIRVPTDIETSGELAATVYEIIARTGNDDDPELRVSMDESSAGTWQVRVEAVDDFGARIGMAAFNVAPLDGWLGLPEIEGSEAATDALTRFTDLLDTWGQSHGFRTEALLQGAELESAIEDGWVWADVDDFEELRRHAAAFVDAFGDAIAEDRRDVLLELIAIAAPADFPSPRDITSQWMAPDTRIDVSWRLRRPVAMVPNAGVADQAAADPMARAEYAAHGRGVTLAQTLPSPAQIVDLDSDVMARAAFDRTGIVSLGGELARQLGTDSGVGWRTRISEVRADFDVVRFDQEIGFHHDGDFVVQATVEREIHRDGRVVERWDIEQPDLATFVEGSTGWVRANMITATMNQSLRMAQDQALAWYVAHEVPEVSAVLRDGAAGLAATFGAQGWDWADPDHARSALDAAEALIDPTDHEARRQWVDLQARLAAGPESVGYPSPYDVFLIGARPNRDDWPGRSALNDIGGFQLTVDTDLVTGDAPAVFVRDIAPAVRAPTVQRFLAPVEDILRTGRTPNDVTFDRPGRFEILTPNTYSGEQIRLTTTAERLGTYTQVAVERGLGLTASVASDRLIAVTIDLPRGFSRDADTAAVLAAALATGDTRPVESDVSGEIAPGVSWRYDPRVRGLTGDVTAARYKALVDSGPQGLPIEGSQFFARATSLLTTVPDGQLNFEAVQRALRGLRTGIAGQAASRAGVIDATYITGQFPERIVVALDGRLEQLAQATPDLEGRVLHDPGYATLAPVTAGQRNPTVTVEIPAGTPFGHVDGRPFLPRGTEFVVLSSGNNEIRLEARPPTGPDPLISSAVVAAELEGGRTSSTPLIAYIDASDAPTGDFDARSLQFHSTPGDGRVPVVIPRGMKLSDAEYGGVARQGLNGPYLALLRDGTVDLPAAIAAGDPTVGRITVTPLGEVEASMLDQYAGRAEPPSFANLGQGISDVEIPRLQLAPLPGARVVSFPSDADWASRVGESFTDATVTGQLGVADAPPGGWRVVMTVPEGTPGFYRDGKVVVADTDITVTRVDEDSRLVFAECGPSKTQRLQEAFDSMADTPGLDSLKVIELLESMDDVDAALVLADKLLVGRATEPGITATLQRIASANSGEMRGLEFVYKDPGKVVEKVHRKKAASNNTKTELELAERIGDVVRYTMEFASETYTRDVQQALDEMAAQGWVIEEVENNWFGGDAYNGINVIFRTPEGLPVEMQFHTPESFVVKQVMNHPLYENLRKVPPIGTPEQRLAWQEEMRRNSDAVIFPDGVEAIGERVFRGFVEPLDSLSSEAQAAVNQIDLTDANGDQLRAAAITTLAQAERFQTERRPQMESALQAATGVDRVHNFEHTPSSIVAEADFRAYATQTTPARVLEQQPTHEFIVEVDRSNWTQDTISGVLSQLEAFGADINTALIENRYSDVDPYGGYLIKTRDSETGNVYVVKVLTPTENAIQGAWDAQTFVNTLRSTEGDAAERRAAMNQLIQASAPPWNPPPQVGLGQRIMTPPAAPGVPREIADQGNPLGDAALRGGDGALPGGYTPGQRVLALDPRTDTMQIASVTEIAGARVGGRPTTAPRVVFGDGFSTIMQETQTTPVPTGKPALFENAIPPRRDSVEALDVNAMIDPVDLQAILDAAGREIGDLTTTGDFESDGDITVEGRLQVAKFRTLATLGNQFGFTPDQTRTAMEALGEATRILAEGGRGRDAVVDSIEHLSGVNNDGIPGEPRNDTERALLLQQGWTQLALRAYLGARGESTLKVQRRLDPFLHGSLFHVAQTGDFVIPPSGLEVWAAESEFGPDPLRSGAVLIEAEIDPSTVLLSSLVEPMRAYRGVDPSMMDVGTALLARGDFGPDDVTVTLDPGQDGSYVETTMRYWDDFAQVTEAMSADGTVSLDAALATNFVGSHAGRPLGDRTNVQTAFLSDVLGDPPTDPRALAGWIADRDLDQQTVTRLHEMVVAVQHSQEIIVLNERGERPPHLRNISDETWAGYVERAADRVESEIAALLALADEAGLLVDEEAVRCWADSL